MIIIKDLLLDRLIGHPPIVVCWQTSARYFYCPCTPRSLVEIMARDEEGSSPYLPIWRFHLLLRYLSLSDRHRIPLNHRSLFNVHACRSLPPLWPKNCVTFVLFLQVGFCFPAILISRGLCDKLVTILRFDLMNREREIVGYEEGTWVFSSFISWVEEWKIYWSSIDGSNCLRFGELVSCCSLASF